MVATALAFEEATHLPARPPSLRAWLVSLLFPRQLSSQIPLVKLGSELVDRRKTTDTDEEDIREDIHWSNEKEHYEFISPPCSSCGIRSSEDDDEFENGQEDPTTTREVSSSQEFDREKWTRVKRTTSNAGSAARLSQEGLSRGQRKGRRLKEAFEDEAANDEETEEERLLRSWLNSLAPQRIHLVSLLDPSIRTALPLLKAADIIKPRSVDWSKTYPLPFKPLVQKICCVTNGECLIQTLKGWGLQLVNIGGIDLAEGNRKAILSLVYQMMRYELALLLKGSSHILEGCSGSQSLEKHVVQWANAKLAARKGSSRGGGQDDPSSHDKKTRMIGSSTAAARSPPTPPPAASATLIKCLDDPQLSRGFLFLQLIASIAPDSVKRSHILPGETPEERESNAKYCLSLAKGLGARVFLRWHDLVEQRAKSNLIMLATLCEIDLRLNHQALNHPGPTQASS